MILLLAVLAGLLAGLLRNWSLGRSYAIPSLRAAWLVPVALLPQLLAFQLPATRSLVTDELAALALVSSQFLLLVFAWVNRKQPGFWMLGLGLVLNLTVIVLNGGLMPIRPEIIPQLAPTNAPPGAWQIGKHLGTTKDIVLPVVDTRLWWLSDRYLLPGWFPYKAAFSIGDALISAGSFWLLWSTAGQSKIEQQERMSAL